MCHSSGAINLLFETRSLSGLEVTEYAIGWLTSEFQGSVHLYLLTTGIASAEHHILPFCLLKWAMGLELMSLYL